MSTFNTPAEVCAWANDADKCCHLNLLQMQEAILILACSINTAVVDDLVALLTDIDADVSAIYTLLNNYFNASNDWITESTFGEDLTGGSVELVGAPGVGFKVQVRYLSYGNSSSTPGVLNFVADGDSLYPNWTVQGSIWATRFNKGDYLELGENQALLLNSVGDLIDDATATWEFRIVPV